jgi:hypothetical protein
MNDYLSVRRIEFEVTHRCNSHCVHCQVDDGKRDARPAAIDRDLAVQIVRRVAQWESKRAGTSPHSLMTFGGEPLLYPDAVCAIHMTARDCGIANREIITNAGTPRSGKEARDLAFRLAASGVTGISISVDAFHQEHIPLQVVERNVGFYVEADIPCLEWNPCWVVSAENDNPWNQRTREVLQALAHLPVHADPGNVVQPDGHARQWLREYLPARAPLPTGSCEDAPYAGRLDQIDCISIEPDGGVSICRDWTIGNAAQEDVLQILERYDPYAIPEARAILEGGMTALVELYHTRGVSLDPEGYYTICDLCTSLRRSHQPEQVIQ